MYYFEIMADIPDKSVCSCGNNKNSPMVSVKTRYGTWGLFLLSLAFSAKPIEIVYQCQICGEILDTSTDEELIDKYRYSSDIMR